MLRLRRVSPPPARRGLSAATLGLAALVLALAGCGPAPRPASNAQNHGNQLDGHYTGTGAYVTGITFDVSGGGSSLSRFHGFITASCYTGGSLYSGANHTVYNQYTMDDPGSVAVDGNGDFTSTYTVSDTTKASFTFKGHLDGNGGATGTVSYRNGACASITAPWSASLNGVSPPPIPGVTPSGSADTCDPQPCGTIAPLVLTVDGFHTATWTGHGDAPMLELDFTLTSTSSDGTTGFADRLWLNDSSHEPVGPGIGINSLTLSSGDVVQCDHGATLQPGQKLSLHWCYAQGNLDISQPVRLDWISVRGATVHIDLGTPD